MTAITDTDMDITITEVTTIIDTGCDREEGQGFAVIDFDQRIADGVFSVYGWVSERLPGMTLATTSAFIPFSRAFFG